MRLIPLPEAGEEPFVEPLDPVGYGAKMEAESPEPEPTATPEEPAADAETDEPEAEPLATAEGFADEAVAVTASVLEM